MRVKQDCKLCDLYEKREGRIYSDHRCRVIERDEGVVCIFEQHTQVLSKRQKEWLWHVLKKIGESKFKGRFVMQEVAEGDHYYITGDAKNNTKTKEKVKVKEKKTKSKGSKKQSG